MLLKSKNNPKDVALDIIIARNSDMNEMEDLPLEDFPDIQTGNITPIRPVPYIPVPLPKRPKPEISPKPKPSPKEGNKHG